MSERVDGFLQYQADLFAARKVFGNLSIPDHKAPLISHPYPDTELYETEWKLHSVPVSHRAEVICDLVPRHEPCVFTAARGRQLWVLAYDILNKPDFPLPPRANDFLADVFLLTAASRIPDFHMSYGTGTVLQLTHQQIQTRMIYSGAPPDRLYERARRIAHNLYLDPPLTRELVSQTFPHQIDMGIPPENDTNIDVVRLGLDVLTAFGLVTPLHTNNSEFFERFSLQPPLIDHLYRRAEQLDPA